jgi:TPR repeat protein
MAAWITLFSIWIATGFIEAKHPGDSIPFWKKALAEGKPHAGNSLVMAAGSLAEANGSAAAYNELGLICFEGKLVEPNHPRAAEFFAKASDLGDPNGAQNVVSQYLYYDERLSDAVVERAMARLEPLCASGFDGPACWLLGRAHETGRGRPLDKRRALEFYMRCPAGNPYAAKGIARIGLTTPVPPKLMAQIARDLETARAAGDAESAWYLAFMYFAGVGVERDDVHGRRLLDEACARLSSKSCEALSGTSLPPYFAPEDLNVPPLSTAFPLP